MTAAAPRPPVAIRPARPADRAFVIATTARLADFGPPPWRRAGDVIEGELRTIRAFFVTPAPGAALLVADSSGGTAVGFVYLETVEDYFSQEVHGHIGILAVTAEAEGTGAGSALMRAAEAWAVGRGYRRLTLNVFEGNRHARTVYEHRGYQVETIRYVKLLSE